MKTKILFYLLLLICCLSLVSCESVTNGIKNADNWIKEHMW